MILVFQLIALIINEFQFVKISSYAFQSINLDSAYFYRLFLGFFLLWLLLPKTFAKPSDFFLFLYGLFVVGPFVFFGLINGDSLDSYHLGLLVTMLPIFVVKYSLKLKVKIKTIQLFSTRTTLWFLYFLSIVAVIYSLMNSHNLVGFSLEEIYLRRLEGRKVFVAGSLIAYLIGTLVNGIVPYLAFVAGQKNSKILILPIFISVSFFYLIGLKAQFLYIPVAFLLGFLARSKSYYKLPKIFLLSVIGFFIIIIFEWTLNDGFSYLSDYFFRRTNLTPGQMMSHYLEVITSSNLWSIWSGVDHIKGATYLIGELYYSSTSNANTSTFFFSLTNGGIFSLIFTVLLLIAFYTVLDSVYRRTKNPDFLFIGFFYALIISEQAATTALLSSGYAFIFLILFLKKT